MTPDQDFLDSLLEKLNLRRSPAAWREDPILAPVLESFAGQAASVYALTQPLRILTSSAASVVLFDYAYFLFLRDLCRALSLGRGADGALLALFHFEIGRGLDEAGLAFEGAGLLHSASEIKSSFAVTTTSGVDEAMFYQLAVNVCVAHEQAHLLFADDEQAAADWASEARNLLAALSRDAERMYSDKKTREDILATIDLFLANDGLLEEIACDLSAIDFCLESAAEQRPHAISAYCDAYYAVQRLNMLGLYASRTTASAAALVVKEVLEGRLAAIARIKSNEDLSIMSSLRLRFQILLLKIATLKVRYGLVSAERGFQPLASVIKTDESNFQRLASSLMTELSQARNSIAIHRQIWIGRAIRNFHSEAAPPDNGPLVALCLRGFWFAPFDQDLSGDADSREDDHVREPSHQ